MIGPVVLSCFSPTDRNSCGTLSLGVPHMEVIGFAFTLCPPQQKLPGHSGYGALQGERNRKFHQICIHGDEKEKKERYAQ